MYRYTIQSGAAGCGKCFVTCVLRVPQTVGLNCSCHAAQASKGNSQKTCYKTLYTTCRPRLYLACLSKHLKFWDLSRTSRTCHRRWRQLLRQSPVVKWTSCVVPRRRAFVPISSFCSSSVTSSALRRRTTWSPSAAAARTTATTPLLPSGPPAG